MIRATQRYSVGKDISSITFEDICWQYGVFRCNSSGAGRNKQYYPWRAAKTKLGEIEIHEWCKLAEAVIEREQEESLLKALIQWCSKRNHESASAADIRIEALQLHTSRIFDNPMWVGYISFNKEYRPEILENARMVSVRMDCCTEIGVVTQEQIDHAYEKRIACPHCGRWSHFAVLGRDFLFQQ